MSETLAATVQHPRSLAAWSAGADARTAATGVVAHRIE